MRQHLLLVRRSSRGTQRNVTPAIGSIGRERKAHQKPTGGALRSLSLHGALLLTSPAAHGSRGGLRPTTARRMPAPEQNPHASRWKWNGRGRTRTNTGWRLGRPTGGRRRHQLPWRNRALSVWMSHPSPAVWTSLESNQRAPCIRVRINRGSCTRN